MLHYQGRDPFATSRCAGTGRGWRQSGTGFLFTVLGLLSAPAFCQSIAVVPPIVAVPSYGGGGSSESFLYFRLGDGEAFLVDRLKRDPLAVHRRRLAENLFRAIGRAADQPAVAGEMLLEPIHGGDGSVRAALYVETPIGYVAYFHQLGRDSRIGEFSVAIGRPFAPLAAADGNFALLMERDGSGKTTTAYLYHATTGKCLYFAGVNKLETDLEATFTSPLPTLTGRVAVAPLHAGSKATAGYLVIDSGNGDLYFYDLFPERAGQLAVTKSSRNLFEVFSRETRYSSPQRFLPVSIQESPRVTRHVFLFDAATGEMALVENIDDRTRAPALRKVDRNLDTSLPGNDRMTRVFAAVANVTGSGATVGIWLLDNQTGVGVYIANPALPPAMTVTPVAFGQ